MTRVVVATDEPLLDEMAGPAIRAWNLAEQLAVGNDVAIVSSGHITRTHDQFEVLSWRQPDATRLEQWADVFVVQGGLLYNRPHIADLDAVIVADLYDPFHLESLHQSGGAPLRDHMKSVRRLTDVINRSLDRADFFVCASERQRDFWLGSLAARGRVNPAVYADDPQLQRLIDCVPFGIPTEAPAHDRPVLRGVIDGIGERDVVLLWAGGVYDWFDPLTLLAAVEKVHTGNPDVRLVFLGMQHPNPDIPPMRAAVELRRAADDRGLTNKVVFFNEGWVPYDRRGAYLLEGTIGVSTHHQHIETRFSFRTRILDYLWAGLPIVATEGDTFDELIQREAIGEIVPAEDSNALAGALERVIASPPDRSRVEAVGHQFTWPEVARPLVDFCAAPSRANDARYAPRPQREPLRRRWRVRAR